MLRHTSRSFRTGLLIGFGIMALVRATLVPLPIADQNAKLSGPLAISSFASLSVSNAIRVATSRLSSPTSEATPTSVAPPPHTGPDVNNPSARTNTPRRQSRSSSTRSDTSLYARSGVPVLAGNGAPAERSAMTVPMWAIPVS